MKEDTIAAVATPPGIGAISIIRVSGPETFSIADQIFVGKNRISLAKSHTLHYGHLVDRSGITIDEALLSVFRAPNSYTGEDSVEINIHGSPFIARQALELLVEKGAKLAEPGEFTKRAFLNKRIDLSQAEAVADIIKSSTDVALRGARNQLDGLLSNKVVELRNSLVNLSSFIELELDFSEEDIHFIEQEKLIKDLDSTIAEIDALLKTYNFGRVLKDGANIAIVGQPNVGKSSLLNYILKESRAIVSDIPGTTRDIIREEVSIEGVLVKLFDTAGLRKPANQIEKEGILRSRQVVNDADIIMLVGDVEQGFYQELKVEVEMEILNKTTHILKVLNKIDLNMDSEIICDVRVSAITGIGIDELLRKIKTLIMGSSNFSEKTVIVSNLRHYNCLKQAKRYLLNAKESSVLKMSGEFISVDLRNAEQSLAEIIGVVTTEDILNNIFSNFCIGK